MVTWRQHSGNFENPINPEYEQEARLVEQARAGSERAFSALLARYQQPVFRLIFYLVGEEDDARDLARIALKHALLHMPRVPSGFSIRPWLLRVAVLVALDAVRERSESPQQLLETLQLPAPPQTPKIVDADPTMDDTMVLGVAVRHLAQHPANAIADAWDSLPIEIERELIRRLLSGLPEGDAELLALGVVGQVPTRDLAALAGTSQRSIRRRIARALILFQSRYHEVRQEALPPGPAAPELPRAAGTSPLEAARRGLAQAGERVRRGFQGAQVETNTSDAQERLETLRQADLPSAVTAATTGNDAASHRSSVDNAVDSPPSLIDASDVSSAATIVTTTMDQQAISGSFDTTTWENWTAPVPTLDTVELATVSLPVAESEAGMELPTVHEMPTEVLAALPEIPSEELVHNSLEDTQAEPAFVEPRNTIDADRHLAQVAPFGEDPGATMVAALSPSFDFDHQFVERDTHTGHLAMPTLLEPAEVAAETTLVAAPVAADIPAETRPAVDDTPVAAPELFAPEAPETAEIAASEADADASTYTPPLAVETDNTSSETVSSGMAEDSLPVAIPVLAALPDSDAAAGSAEPSDAILPVDEGKVAYPATLPEIGAEALVEIPANATTDFGESPPELPGSDEASDAESLGVMTEAATEEPVAEDASAMDVSAEEPPADLPVFAAPVEPLVAEYAPDATQGAAEPATDEPDVAMHSSLEQPTDEEDLGEASPIPNPTITTTNTAEETAAPVAVPSFAASQIASEARKDMPLDGTMILSESGEDDAEYTPLAHPVLISEPSEEMAFVNNGSVDAIAEEAPMVVETLPTESATDAGNLLHGNADSSVEATVSDAELPTNLQETADAEPIEDIADAAPATAIHAQATSFPSEITESPAFAAREEPFAEEPEPAEIAEPAFAMETVSTGSDVAPVVDVGQPSEADMVPVALNQAEPADAAPAAEMLPAQPIVAEPLAAESAPEFNHYHEASTSEDNADRELTIASHAEAETPAATTELAAADTAEAKNAPFPEPDIPATTEGIVDPTEPEPTPLTMPQRSGHTVVMPPTQRADYLARHQPNWVDAGDLSGFAGVHLAAPSEDERGEYAAPTVPTAGIINLDEQANSNAAHAGATNQQGDDEDMVFDLADLAGLAHPEVAAMASPTANNADAEAVPVTVPDAEDVATDAQAEVAPIETPPGSRTRTPTRPMPRLERDITDPPHEW